jgi:flagellar motor switch/type III secretory pathway protein FliN
VNAPNFSAYPFSRLRTLTRREAQIESALAQWIAARSRGERLGKLLAARAKDRGVARGGDRSGARGGDRSGARGGDRSGGAATHVRVEVVAPSASFDPFAACAEVRIGGASIEVRGASLAVRAIAQRLLGGPEELEAPRPLTIVERSIWSLVVATALEDLGAPGEVWPVLVDEELISSDSAKTRVGRPSKAERSKGDKRSDDKRAERADDKRAERADDKRAERAEDKRAERADDNPIIELAVDIDELSLAVQVHAPADLLLRVPPPRPYPDWFATTYIDVPIVVGRCALDRRSLDKLATRSVITLERPVHAPAISANSSAPLLAELDVLGGSVGVRAAQGSLEATVATEYVPRDMSLPDDAHVELTVALGTTRLSLREVGELAIGQIVQLGRPLAGPFELRAAGRVVGRGELVDVDGELAVRIVSLGD